MINIITIIAAFKYIILKLSYNLKTAPLLFWKFWWHLSAGLIEQRDSQPLLKLIESVGDWPVAFEDWNSTVGRSNSSCLQFASDKRALAAHPHRRAITFLFKSMCPAQSLHSYICTEWTAECCWLAGWMERFFSWAVRCGVWERDEWADGECGGCFSLLCSSLSSWLLPL